MLNLCMIIRWHPFFTYNIRKKIFVLYSSKYIFFSPKDHSLDEIDGVHVRGAFKF